ncbi:NAD(P)/FAD-dependent oxidoreductase [Cognatishimia sp. D5M38]|jgi:cyclohexanone monooxygenase|uniref:NAD(P)/FAD-dependent oxidoreductase n=1 Tax=Cognatishimia coralii TaxID=3083254 RepID=A0ABU8QK24_9RHOB|nr:NAD(P)/FAD-dependent oxidoreductase [Sulfitobacter sp. PR48]MDD9722822.1 NAD(P)/FAD-dependent oxidoreductase [Sulfitobacter sp. PR48]
MTTKAKNSTADFDVVLVGAGFAGVYLLYHLRKHGYKTRLIEAGHDLGGVWHWNCYPGARVDSIGAIYQFSDPELWQDWDFNEKFPSWVELRKYFHHVDKKWRVRKDCQFDTRVNGAEFDERQRVWKVHKDDGETITCRYFVPCLGFASKPVIPNFPGRDTFRGVAHHSAHWPQYGLDMDDKRIAIIGTGASAVQILQEASKTARQVTVFQRTPNLTIPMRQKKLSKADNVQMKAHYPEIFETRPRTFAGFEFDFHPRTWAESSEEERKATFQEIWEMGAFNWWLGNFNDVLSNPAANRAEYDYWRDQTRKRIKKPELIELLAPTDPPHPFGVKRPCLEQHFYECFNQDNVELVDVNKYPIDRIYDRGIFSGGKEREFDIIVYATGFDAVSGGMTQIDIKGTDGRNLRQHWSKGITTHLGMAIPDFPNLLMSYGPQSPSGFCNGPTCAELQGDWIIQFIEDMDQKGVSRIEADTEASANWARTTIEIADQTLFPQGDSWYVGANIPGKTREFLIYPGGVPTYLKAIRKEAESGYPGFSQMT